MPAGRISIQSFARAIDQLCTQLDVESPVVVGNSMGGFIGAELALAFPTRVQKLVLVSAAGISAEHMWKEPVMAIGRLMAVSAARAGVKQLPVASRPRLRRAALQLVVRYPERLSVPLASELVVGAGTPGFVGGLDAVLDYSYRERLAEIEIPVLIVWGRNDILIPVADAYEYERLIGEQRPCRRVRRHGPSLDARAPVPVQRAALRVHRCVIAPSLALETCWAYLPSTPRVIVGGGS